MTPVLLDVSSFGMSPIFIIIVLGFAAWKIISWIIYSNEKSKLDAQIAVGQLGPSPGDAAGTATVCVYRPSNFAGALSAVYIFCDQAPIASLKNGAHAVCQVAPGKHVFSSSASPSTFNLNLQAGQLCFFRTGLTASGFEPVSPAQARSECAALRSLPEPPRMPTPPGEPPPIIGLRAEAEDGVAKRMPPPPPAEAKPVNAAPAAPATTAPRLPPEGATSKLLWYQHAWTALPILLVAVGGLIGGACGGAAWAVNQQVFRTTKDPVLRYVWTGLISAGAVAAYLIIAMLVASLLAPKG